jgi:hypothetical protein
VRDKRTKRQTRQKQVSLDKKGGEGDAQAILKYMSKTAITEALQNELNKQGLGGNGQSALEQMKQIEKQLLKVLRTKRFKRYQCKTGIIKIEHRHSTTGRGKQTPI